MARISSMEGEGMMDWQQSCETVVERDSYILHHEMWTDCIFIVGPDKKAFKVHRLMLAKSSPAMAAMLYGPLYEKDKPIDVPDITPAAFSAMMLYMYEGRVQLDNFEIACELLYASKKYLLHASLLARLRAFLWRSLYPDNMWRALTFASNNDEPRLLETALQLIHLDTSQALLLNSFLEISQSQLVSLVQCDQLAVGSELELYEASERWAERDVQRRGEEETTENLREALAPVIPHFRFLTMNLKEFANGPALCDVITHYEAYRIFLVLSECDRIYDVPASLCCERTPRRIPRIKSFFVFGTNVKHHEASKYNIGDVEIENTHNAMSIADFYNNTSNTFKELGIVIPTQLKEPDSGDEDSYDEDLTVLLIKRPQMKIISANRFKYRVNYNSTVQVAYNKYVDVEPGTKLRVKVEFHKSGRYPAKLVTDNNIRYKDIFNGTLNADFFSAKIFKYVHYVVGLRSFREV